MNDRKKAVHVGTVVLETVKGHLWLSFTILAVVAGAISAGHHRPQGLEQRQWEGSSQLRDRNAV